MRKLIYCDLETTGLDPLKDKIVECAILYEQVENGKTVYKKVFHEYCLPFEERPLNYDEAEKITGITWEFLQEHGISEKELFDKIVIFLDEKIKRYDKEDKAFLLAYNANFDSDFLHQLFKNCGNDKIHFGNYMYHLPVDIMQTAITCYMLDLIDQPDNFKNITIAKHLGIECDENKAHSALNDIKVSRVIHIALTNRLKEWGQQKNVS